jgi:predicted kinase
MNWIKKILGIKPNMVDYPKNTSWLLNDDLSPNKNNLEHCKEFYALKQTKQSKKWHKEGDAFKHTILVADNMYKIINNQLKNISSRDKRILMIAALCHDLGKATTTYFDKNEKDWKCKSHGEAGDKITRNLIFNEEDKWLREEVCWLVRWHMVFHHLLDKPYNNQLKEIQRLSFGNSTIKKLLWLNYADSLGSISPENKIEIVDSKFKIIRDLAVDNKCYESPFKVEHSKSNFNMYVMIGVPGSGKDTYIQKFLPEVECICRDDIREEITYGKVEGRKLMLDNVKEGIVTDIVNSRIKKCCEEHKSFVINQTNVKKKYRELLKETALKYGSPNIIYVYVEAPSIEECKERRGHGKWDSIIDRMWNDFEFPDRGECSELIWYKQ